MDQLRPSVKEVEQTTPQQPAQQSEQVQQQMPQQRPQQWGANWGSSQNGPHYEMQMPHEYHAGRGSRERYVRQQR